LAVVIAQRAGVGTGLVDDDDRVQSAAAGVQLADQGTAHQKHSKRSTLKTAVHKSNTYDGQYAPAVKRKALI